MAPILITMNLSSYPLLNIAEVTISDVGKPKVRVTKTFELGNFPSNIRIITTCSSLKSFQSIYLRLFP